MRLQFTAAEKTDVGKQREQNEDSVYKRVESSDEGDRGLFVVADGMGGYKAGEVASKLAVETMAKAIDVFFKPLPDQPTIQLEKSVVDPDETIKLATNTKNASSQKTQKLDDTQTVVSVEDLLSSAIQQANKEIMRYGEQKPAARGLGSTVTAALVRNDHAYIANVGDSRTYLLRDNILKPITRDHSLVARLVESKQIEPEDVYTHPQRNLIYRSLGAGNKNIEVDVFHEILKPGDKLLLCSDGLWEMVHQQDLLQALNSQESPQVICNRLIDKANENGGEDNISAVIVQVNAY
jgi:serine/threonine protein phosphatase PrpC